jgi:hypothetical protein
MGASIPSELVLLAERLRLACTPQLPQNLFANGTGAPQLAHASTSATPQFRHCRLSAGFEAPHVRQSMGTTGNLLIG